MVISSAIYNLNYHLYVVSRFPISRSSSLQQGDKTKFILSNYINYEVMFGPVTPNVGIMYAVIFDGQRRWGICQSGGQLDVLHDVLHY
jgi:hypothetical protein